MNAARFAVLVRNQQLVTDFKLAEKDYDRLAAQRHYFPNDAEELENQALERLMDSVERCQWELRGLIRDRRAAACQAKGLLQ